jgi:Zn-dependent peptidase ImmA (M78 family)
LSYTYISLSSPALEDIAGVILARFASRRSGFFVDIEGITEDLGITILPRRGNLLRLVEGYAPRDPRFIVVPEDLASYLPRYRTAIAEELCHIILEYKLLDRPQLPQGFEAHRLTFEQHQAIERDAKYLALAVLLPIRVFTERFKFHQEDRHGRYSDRGNLLRGVADILELEFEVSFLKVAYRARDLHLISADECKSNFSDRLAF